MSVCVFDVHQGNIMTRPRAQLSEMCKYGARSTVNRTKNAGERKPNTDETKKTNIEYDMVADVGWWATIHQVVPLSAKTSFLFPNRVAVWSVVGSQKQKMEIISQLRGGHHHRHYYHQPRQQQPPSIVFFVLILPLSACAARLSVFGLNLIWLRRWLDSLVNKCKIAEWISVHKRLAYANYMTRDTLHGITWIRSGHRRVFSKYIRARRSIRSIIRCHTADCRMEFIYSSFTWFKRKTLKMNTFAYNASTGHVRIMGGAGGFDMNMFAMWPSQSIEFRN